MEECFFLNLSSVFRIFFFYWKIYGAAEINFIFSFLIENGSKIYFFVVRVDPVTRELVSSKSRIG